MIAETSQSRVHVFLSALALSFIGLLLSSYSSQNNWTTKIGENLLSSLAHPIQGAAQSGFKGVSSLWESYFWLIDVSDENLVLRAELAKSQKENLELREFQLENERLKKLLGVKESKKLDGIEASVIGYNPSNWTNSITLNKGTNQGIQEGSIVVNAHGVIGQVVSAHLNSSTAILITDHASGVDALIQRTRARGVLEGRGSKKCLMKYILNDDDVAEDDIVITSGMDGVYPKGLMIGKVKTVTNGSSSLFKKINVEPNVDFKRIENVLIVKSEPVNQSVNQREASN